MTVSVHADTSELRDALARYDGAPEAVQRAIEEAIGELWDGFMSELIGYEVKDAPIRGGKSGGSLRLKLDDRHGGANVWHVGRRLRGRSDYYLKHDDPRGKPSGRSLRAWHAVLKDNGTTVVLRNNTRDTKGRNYARYVRGEGEPVGQSLENAREVFGEMAGMAATRATEAIKAAMLGESVS